LTSELLLAYLVTSSYSASDSFRSDLSVRMNNIQ
jgi:hypothetical protein